MKADERGKPMKNEKVDEEQQSQWRAGKPMKNGMTGSDYNTNVTRQIFLLKTIYRPVEKKLKLGRIIFTVIV